MLLKSKRLVLALCLFIPPCAAFAEDWPQFLGPQRNGISAETGLLESWPEGGPKKVWRVDGGVGMASVVIAKGKAITMLQRGGKQRVVAYEAKSGKPLWDVPVAPDYRNQQGNGPRATPCVNDGRVFAFTGEGVLVALDLSTGRLLWRRDTLRELKGREAEYGMASSPLVVNGRVLVTCGAPGATVVAFDVEEGKVAWKAGQDRAGYSSAALLKVAGQQQLVAFTGQSAMGLTDDGKLLWRHPYVTDFDCNIATPIAHKGDVFISSGENHGCALLRLTPKGAAFNVEEVWTSQGGGSVMRNAWQTSIIAGEHLYGFDNVGAAGPVMHISCLNIADGKLAWRKTRFGKGNLIAADGKLFISTMRGELVVAKISPKAYEEIGRAKVIGTTRQAPTLSNGLLYLRDDDDIVCLDVRK